MFVFAPLVAATTDEETSLTSTPSHKVPAIFCSAMTPEVLKVSNNSTCVVVELASRYLGMPIYRIA